MRALVRKAGSEVAGGWGFADRERHAKLALDEAQRRFHQAIKEQIDTDDRAAIESLALGLNVATENNIFDPWLIEAIRESPTIQGLAPLISAAPRLEASGDLADVLDFLKLRARQPVEDVTPRLRDLWLRRTAIASSAGLWRAYDLRTRGEVEAALQQIQDLIDQIDDRPGLYRNQYVTTLRLDRRFKEAAELLHS